jgi:hypothetical protein
LPIARTERGNVRWRAWLGRRLSRRAITLVARAALGQFTSSSRSDIDKFTRDVRAYALQIRCTRPQTKGASDMSENKNPGQRSPQSGSDVNKPNKQGGMGEKPVGNPKNPGQKQDINSGTRQPGANPNKPSDIDDRSTQRSPQRPLDPDEDK